MSEHTEGGKRSTLPTEGGKRSTLPTPIKLIESPSDITQRCHIANDFSKKKEYNKEYIKEFQAIIKKYIKIKLK